MIEKCNKIYSLFDHDTIVSNQLRINAVKGYDIVDIGNVGGTDDITKWFRSNNKFIDNIPASKLYRFTNPIAGSEWYIGNYMIAYSGSGYSSPKIEAFFYRDTALVDNFDALYKYRFFLGRSVNVKRVYKIGYLSTPHRAIINYTDSKPTKVKLPFVV